MFTQNDLSSFIITIKSTQHCGLVQQESGLNLQAKTKNGNVLNLELDSLLIGWTLMATSVATSGCTKKKKKKNKKCV